MKRAVSISIGSSKRDKAVEVELLGEKISIERIGTDGDMKKAGQMFAEMDGKVDAFGVGGADLGLMVDDKWYPLHSVTPMVKGVKQTPVVDGTGLKITLESKMVSVMEAKIGGYLQEKGKTAFVTSGADRWGMTQALLDGGFECIFGDLMFGLGIPIPLRTAKGLKRVAALLMPIASRLPFEWIYPIGEKQNIRDPKYLNHYAWGTVISGDRHFIVRHMPEKLEGKIIATNTTTEEDVEIFRNAGVKYMITSTPVLNGRSFGTNMMEAALVALAGKGRPLTHAELTEMLEKLQFEPQIQELN